MTPPGDENLKRFARATDLKQNAKSSIAKEKRMKYIKASTSHNPNKYTPEAVKNPPPAKTIKGDRTTKVMPHNEH